MYLSHCRLDIGKLLVRHVVEVCAMDFGAEGRVEGRDRDGLVGRNKAWHGHGYFLRLFVVYLDVFHGRVC